MKKTEKGSMTILLALSMITFLSLCLVLVEGSRMYYLKVKAAQAMELAQFSVLSEYQQELLQIYGVFFLELDYEQGKEQRNVLENRAANYLSLNAGELQSTLVSAENFRRATDGGGMPFFRQAVEQSKVKSGYKILEELLGSEESISEQMPDIGTLLEENEDEANAMLGEYVDEEGVPLFDISLPGISFPSIDALTEAVFGTLDDLSEKSVDLKERIGWRTLATGKGTKESISITDMHLFHGYLLDHFYYYGSKNTELSRTSMEYQLEYIISGKDSDRKNLEDIMWRIFLLRAGGNYLFYHQDSERTARAEAEAAAIAGITGNPELIEIVREIILLSQAVEEGIGETKQIYAGGKVPLYQEGVFSGLEMGYEEYLYLFLNLTGSTDKIFRCMDIVELEVRVMSGYENFRMDHCTDRFELQWTYRFDSLFQLGPVGNEGSYENTVTAVCNYEI